MLMYGLPEHQSPIPKDVDDEIEIFEPESEEEDLAEGGGQAMALQERDEREAEQVESDDDDLGPLGPEQVKLRIGQEVCMQQWLH